MNNRSFKLGLPHFHRRRRPGRVPSGTLLALVKPVSEPERTEGIEDILRWADDGGQILDAGSLIARSNPDAARGQPTKRLMDVRRAGS